MHAANPPVKRRLDELEAKLATESPILVDAIKAFRRLDATAYEMGLLDGDDSYASTISWWPCVSILGTFSAGKSSFVNYVLGSDLQRTGNQAVDDKFTVLCYSPDPEPKVLPGVALDSDPRFPFFRISEQLDLDSPGEGQRIDAYLQLKTSNHELLKGCILIDSPGFDADAQRTAVLRIVDHIIDLSDLVLVFFDARRPEPGAMRDTLRHLVGGTVRRHDSDKFVFVLNQLDATAREDNAEEIVAAWQRCLAEHGLTAGRFYCIYNPQAAMPIEDAQLRARYEAKRDRDLGEVLERISKVENGRAYRIVSSLGKTAAAVEAAVPRLEGALDRWRNRVLVLDGVVFGLLGLLALLFWWGSEAPVRQRWLDSIGEQPWVGVVMAVVALAGLLFVHLAIRTAAANAVGRRLGADPASEGTAGSVRRAFERSTRPGRSMLLGRPAGWSRAAQRGVAEVRQVAADYVRRLNDHFASAGAQQESEA